jgi:hypothetical protein
MGLRCSDGLRRANDQELERFRPQPTEYSRSVVTKTESPASLGRRKDSRPPAVKLYRSLLPQTSTATLAA